MEPILFEFDNKKILIYKIIQENDNFIYCQSDDINVDELNIKLSLLNPSVNIIEYIKKYNFNNKSDIIKIDDYMELFQKKKIKSKYENNQENMFLFFEKIKNNKLNTDIKIPNELLLSNEQRFNLIIEEINKLNRDFTHPYYIVCNNDNPYDLSIRLPYKTGILGDKLKKINEKYNYDYFELNFKISETLYPFIPPIITYIKPHIDLNLIINILKMDLWNFQNWNYTISLDNLVITLGNELQKYFEKYFDENKCENNQFDNLLLNIINYIDDIDYDKLDIKLDYNKITINNSNFWKAGTGYGSSSNVSNWNIEKYFEQTEYKNNLYIECLNKINDYIKINENIDNVLNSILIKHIYTKLKSTNVLDFNKNIEIYKTIGQILFNIINKVSNTDIYNNIYININDIVKEINTILNISKNYIDDDLLNTYLLYCSIYDTIKNKIDILKKDILQKNQINNYIDMVNMYNFDEYEINDNHLYYKKINEIISPKTIVRLVSEFSTLKKNLPTTWDSSIIFRTSDTNINFVSFIIVGPKDTPYENGLFEFHAYFPNNYPNVVPQVLLKTTGNKTVRFNPNLYNCGKVCLSLLGTWMGEKSEMWNPQLSTFLQVLISIQSLILIEQPYFNEPGFEKSMTTQQGINNSKKYNDNIRLQTIRVAMVDMIKNKPQSYEDFITEHFKYKKDEIFKTIEKWIDESQYYKTEIIKYYEELKTLHVFQ
jgi:ubiquitin-protein ligase